MALLVMVLALSGASRGPAWCEEARGHKAAHGHAKSRDGLNDPGTPGGQGGVAGTGLGKLPPAGDAPGTGNSVKGPPGQGLTAPVDTLQ